MDKKELHPLDVRNWTKEESMQKLFKAEMTYLASRGWQMLCGTRDSRYYVSPEDDYKAEETKLYTHDEALQIQKEKDSKDV